MWPPFVNWPSTTARRRTKSATIISARILIRVRGTGNKDRYVPLPGRTLELLRAYWATHRHPVFIFPDRQDLTSAKGPMSKRGVQRAGFWGCAERKRHSQAGNCAYLAPFFRAPVRASGQYIIGYDLSPETGLLTLAVQSVKPLWTGQLSGDMSES